MSARQECKNVGLYGLTELCTITGKSRQTLYTWYKQEYDLFITVLVGAVANKSMVNDNTVDIGNKLKLFDSILNINMRSNKDED